MTTNLMFLICAILLLMDVVLIVYYESKLKPLTDASKEYTVGRDRIVKFFDQMNDYRPGRRGIIKKFSLVYKSTNHNFEVDYEIEILEVTENEVKIKCHGFTSMDHEAKDPSNRSGIINFIDDTWVSKKDITLIMDTQSIRQEKLDKILNDTTT
jgi:hypothetical protein